MLFINHTNRTVMLVSDIKTDDRPISKTPNTKTKKKKREKVKTLQNMILNTEFKQRGRMPCSFTMRCGRFLFETRNFQYVTHVVGL